MNTTKLGLGLGAWRTTILLGFAAVFGVTHADEPTKQASAPTVRLLRVPNGGIQPQCIVDSKGVLHLIYFGGDARFGDIFYVRSADGECFSAPLRVNGRPGSAIAIGNIRGAHLALGKGDRVHVAWMGSDKAEPRGPAKSSPMLYARLNDAGAAFEPERSIIQKAIGLDGGGSVAADRTGNVYVTWHASEPGTRGEDSRCVWVARSPDEGKTFAHEVRANADPTGCCGCCGMRAYVSKNGSLFVLYRSASEVVHRDMHLMMSGNGSSGFKNERIDPWNVKTCPMSSMAFSESDDGVVAAWETDGQVHCSRVDPGTGKPSAILAAPGKGNGRKHPVVACNDAGETILVWTEGMGWNKGGTLAWQVFDKAGKPTANRGSKVNSVPTWSLVSVFARPDGGFTILH